jgi:hypothetical protein
VHATESATGALPDALPADADFRVVAAARDGLPDLVSTGNVAMVKAASTK